MKIIRRCLSVMVFVILFFVGAIEANAINTEFLTEELAENEKQTFISNVKISLLTEAPAKKAILCFDVNEEEMIAIGQAGANGKELCVYSADGVFLYGYTFIGGQSFGVEWDDDCINIYFVRSDVIMSVDPCGNILEVKKVQNTMENNVYKNYLLYSPSRMIGDTVYSAENDMGILNLVALSYSQLIATNADGEEVVLYDVNSMQLTKIITVFIIGVLLSIVVLATALHYWTTRRDKGNRFTP